LGFEAWVFEEHKEDDFLLQNFHYLYMDKKPNNL